MTTAGLTREARRATLNRFRSSEHNARMLYTPDKSPALIVAADASRARLLLAATGTAEVNELDDLNNPQAHLHEGDLIDDSPGRRNAAQAGASMKRHRIEEFAALVCRRVEKCLEENCAKRVYIIAEPEFLGLLRRQARPRLARSFAGEVAKSMTSASATEIRAALPARL